jgi:hypothetical protein
VSKILDNIKDQVEAEGFPVGTPAYEERVLSLQVEMCQQLKNNPCNLCPYLDECSLAQRFYQMVRSRNDKRK